MACQGTFTFPNGTLQVGGKVFFNTKTNTLTIRHGTGAYTGAGGRFTIRTPDAKHATETFAFS